MTKTKAKRQPANPSKLIREALATGHRITIWVDDWSGHTIDDRDLDRPGEDGIEFRHTLAGYLEARIRNEIEDGDPRSELLLEHALLLVEEIRASGCMSLDEFNAYRERLSV
ncbi:hypothetical protein [Singulisphaera sp. PoT]|uniref:hypothetical protein n=1 Tax=Singulisphaera sp. PoT TaxID=3411797 RepID=UPI003BF58833